VDFYHVCNYLSAAATAVTNITQAAEVWMVEQKERLKAQRVSELMQALRPRLEPASLDDDDAPVRQCHRYLSHRMHQLDYQFESRRRRPSPTPPAPNPGVRPPDPKCSRVDLRQARDRMPQLFLCTIKGKPSSVIFEIPPVCS
jgi:hypothetical protein